MRKKLFMFFSATLVIGCLIGTSPPVSKAEGNYTVTGAGHCINNDVVGIDYKVSEQRQKEILEDLKLSYLSKVEADESDKYVNTNDERSISTKYLDGDQNSMISKEYLVKHNILETKKKVRWKSTHFVVKSYEEEKEAWDKEFDDKYESYYNSVAENQSITTKQVIENFNSYVDEILNSKFIKDLKDDNKNDATRFQTNLKKRKVNLKKAVTGKAPKVAVESFKKAMASLKKYARGFKPPTLMGDDDDVTMTDFLPLLYKAAWGPKESRPIVFKKPSIRNATKYSQCTLEYWNGGKAVTALGDYWDTGKWKDNARFTYGDFYYYLSSNVNEIYYKELVDKGLIGLEDFNGTKAGKAFKKDYEKFDETLPTWSTSRGIADSTVSGALGSTMSSNSNGISYNDISYFKNEDLSCMEIYKYVEDVLRASEKDVSETESDIITYKYGLKYLQSYTGSDLKTLKFLIAKGILNFEDQTEFEDLNGTMEFSRLYQILYRVACKDARYDFSQVTLTDSDSYWMKKGYAESATGVFKLESSDFVMDSGTARETGTEEGLEADTEKRASLGFGMDTVLAEDKEYKVTFRLSQDVDWKYDGTSVKSLAGSGGSKTATVKSTAMNYNGTKVKVYEITITVQAQTPNKAISKAKKLITCKAGEKNSVETITSVKHGDSEEYTMISQSALKQSFSNISVLEDKVLLNTATNTQAILFDDLGYAMVGNTVIRTSGMICHNVGSEVYYNLKVIVSMLDDSFLQKIGATVGIYKAPKAFKPYTVGAATEYDTNYSKVSCISLKTDASMMKGYSDDEYKKGSIIPYYRVNDITDGINTMTRKYKVKLGDTVANIHLVVDWTFAIPAVDEFDNPDVVKAFSQKKNLTQAQVTKYLYKRPSKSKTLAAWWDSNYVASNALVNFMLGTEKVDYVSSGWLAPCVTLLIPKAALDKYSGEKWAAQLFTGISCCSYKGKTSEDSNLLSSYLGSGTSWNTWFTTFYNSSAAFNGAEDGADQDMLGRMCDRFRSINYFSGNNVKKYGGTSYSLEYFVSKAGVMYKNAEHDTDRLLINKKKGKVTDITLKTRSNTSAKAKKDKTIVQYKRGNTTRKFLYRGLSHDGNLMLTPIDNPIHRSVITKSGKRDKLYNGAMFTVKSTSRNSKSSVIIDRGVPTTVGRADLEYNNRQLDEDKDLEGTTIDEYNRFERWHRLYNRWKSACFGDKAVLSAGTGTSAVDLWNAFSFNSACIKAAEANGASFGDYDSFIDATRYSGKKATKDNNAYNSVNKGAKATTAFSKAIFTLKKVGMVTNTEINGGKKFKWRDALGAPATSNQNRTGLVPDTIDSKKNGIKYVVGNRVSLSLPLIQGKGSDETKKFRPGFNKSDGKRIYADNRYFVFAVPLFHLPTSDWSIAVDDSSGIGTLTGQGTATAITFGNYYSSGILRSVQETIIAKYVKTMSLGDLNPGDTVSFAGFRYKVDAKDLQNKSKGVWLTSVSLNGAGSRNSLRDAAARWSNNLTKQMHYKNEVKNILKDTMIQCDSALYPITNYIIDKTKSGSNSGIQVGGLSTSAMAKKYGLVYCKNNKIYGYKKGKSKAIKGNTNSYRLVRIRLNLDKKLKVRPITDEGNKYVLAPVTVSGNIGMADNDLFYFQEDLSYDDNKYPSIGIENTKFNPSAAFNAAKKKFMKLYAKAFAGDLRTLVLAIICSVAIYLSVISWIAYAVLHYGVLQMFFEVIASGPGKMQGTGFDVVKFFSFGIYSLDDDPPLYRIVIIQLICAIVAAICLNLV